jgi:hypothetical protein
MTFGLSAGAIAAIAGGAAAVGGAAISANASRSASRAQGDAARAANELSQEQFDAIRSDLSPYRELGAGSSNVLAQLLGIPAQYTGPRESLTEIRNRLMASQGPTGQIGSGGARVHDGAQTMEGGRVITWMNGVPYEVVSDNNPEGANTYYNRITDYNPQPYDGSKLDAEAQRLFDQQEGEFAKWQAAQQAQASNPQFGSLMRNFTGEDLEKEPGYAFGLAEGNKALDRRFASGGNYFSGAALKGATRFAQDYAGTKFGEAFNRDSANKTRQYNFLTGATSLGQNAAAQTGNAGQAMAQQVGVNTIGAANAQGAAGIAGANAWSGNMNNLASYYQQGQLMDRITGGNAGWTSAPAGGTNNNLGYGPSQSTGMYGLGSSFDQYRTS